MRKTDTKEDETSFVIVFTVVSAKVLVEGKVHDVS